MTGKVTSPMAKRRKASEFGPYKGYWPQKFLYEYLNIDIDPYDFPRYMLRDWAEEAGVSVDEDSYADSLSKKQLQDYKQWLIKHNKDAEYLQASPSEAPSYLTLKFPEKTPKGTWGIHYTNEGIFESFQYGATIPRLALSTWYEQKEKARCPENLTDKLGTYEYVYIFSFKATRYPLSYGARKYGKNAILFQTDAGVEADHLGDEEHQLIVPACSEYNVIPLRAVDEGIIVCSFKDEEKEGLEFESIENLIRYVETEEKKGSRPLARIEC